MFDQNFIKYAQQVLGDETPLLLESLKGRAPVSVRLNPYKITAAPGGEVVPWCRHGRYLAERPSFTRDPLFHAGHYYVQEASSMFVGHLVESTCAAAGGAIAEGTKILDLCAAPGGKSTLYSSLAGPGGLVVANEVARQRAGVLADNVRKWGVGNVVVTNNDPDHFGTLRGWFDVVAVDAPCSGEGMFRKDPAAREQWSHDTVRLCSSRQRRILADVWDALAPGGVLIYSTCTFNRCENEENIEWLAENFDCGDAGVQVPPEWGIVRTEAAGISCFRFFPHRVKGEGFFACAVRKGGQRERAVNPRPRRQLFAAPSKAETAELRRWVGQPEYMEFARVGDSLYGYYGAMFRDIRGISENLSALHSGVCMGQMFGTALKPDHSLAMFHDLSPGAANRAVLGMEDALRFLGREEIGSIDSLVPGLNLITFDGAPLGWAKRVGNRANNLYPKSLAIQYRTGIL